MKKLTILLLISLICVVLWLLWRPGLQVYNLFFTHEPAIVNSPLPTPPHYAKGEDALHEGDFVKALEMIENGMAEAADSDDYYRFEVLKSKYYYMTMNVDSFLLSHQRLTSYLNRHQDHPTLKQRHLEIEKEMQLGVYAAKMVGRMDSALVHDLRALQLSEQLGSNSNRLIIYINIADAYKQSGQYDKSVSFFHKAMELGDSLNMLPATRITITIGFASTYASMGNFDSSNHWWLQAAELMPQMTTNDLFQYYNNRGNDYYLQDRYEESLQYFLKLDSLISDKPDMEWERMFERCNLSDLYIKTGQIKKALPLLQQSEQFFTKWNQLIPLYYLTTQRIELYMLQGNIQKALQLAETQKGPSWMIPDQVLLRMKVLMRVYKETGNWKQYADAIASYHHLHDSIADDNARMRLSVELAHCEHDLIILSKQRQLEKKELSFRWAQALLIASIIVIILMVVVVTLKLREHRLKETGMRNHITALKMETVRNRITPHFISNALTAEMLAQMDGKPVNLDQLAQLLHRGIEFTGTEATTLASELEFIRFYCHIESRSLGDDFRLHIEQADDVNTQQVLLPSMTVQILVENSIKHGLKPKKPQAGCERSVWVRISNKENGTLVEVIDNGVGLQDSRHIKEHTGLRVVRQLISMLNEQNKTKMAFAIENYTHPNGEKGCRSWLFLPHDFNFSLLNNQTSENNGK